MIKLNTQGTHLNVNSNLISFNAHTISLYRTIEGKLDDYHRILNTITVLRHSPIRQYYRELRTLLRLFIASLLNGTTRLINHNISVINAYVRHHHNVIRLERHGIGVLVHNVRYLHGLNKRIIRQTDTSIGHNISNIINNLRHFFKVTRTTLNVLRRPLNQLVSHAHLLRRATHQHRQVKHETRGTHRQQDVDLGILRILGQVTRHQKRINSGITSLINTRMVRRTKRHLGASTHGNLNGEFIGLILGNTQALLNRSLHSNINLLILMGLSVNIFRINQRGHRRIDTGHFKSGSNDVMHTQLGTLSDLFTVIGRGPVRTLITT